jgi:DNA-binding transcriptional MerR regulator
MRKRKPKPPVEERPVSISTASALVKVETHTIRYWEREFAEFLNPVRTAGGQRRYRPEDIEVLKEIKRLLKEELYTIAGAKRKLAERFEAQSPSSRPAQATTARTRPNAANAPQPRADAQPRERGEPMPTVLVRQEVPHLCGGVGRQPQRGVRTPPR